MVAIVGGSRACCFAFFCSCRRFFCGISCFDFERVRFAFGLGRQGGRGEDEGWRRWDFRPQGHACTGRT